MNFNDLDENALKEFYKIKNYWELRDCVSLKQREINLKKNKNVLKIPDNFNGIVIAPGQGVVE